MIQNTPKGEGAKQEPINDQDRELARGMWGLKIRRLHNQLKLLGSSIPKRESWILYYGAGTRAAVETYQAKNSIRVSGMIDKPTARILRVQVEQKETLLKIGACGPKIRILHRKLSALGYIVPKRESFAWHYGRGTQAAVKRYQEWHSLNESGVVDPTTATSFVAELERIELYLDRKKRQYNYSKLPVLNSKSEQTGTATGAVSVLLKLVLALQPELKPPSSETLLLALYSQVRDSWRMLTDVRFKLLGFVPAASIVLLIPLLSKTAPQEGLSVFSRALICLLGLAVSIGLFIYDQRNTELYDDLVSRGRRLEKELGVETGQFLGRKKPSSFFLQHDKAIFLIYIASSITWECSLIFALFNLI